MGPAVVVNLSVCPHPVGFSFLVSFSFLFSASYPLKFAPSHFYFYIYVLLVIPSLAQGSFTSKDSLQISFLPPCDVLKGPRPSLLFATGVFCTFSCACSCFIKKPRPPHSLSTFWFSRFSSPEGDPGAAVWAVTL